MLQNLLKNGKTSEETYSHILWLSCRRHHIMLLESVSGAYFTLMKGSATVN